MKVISQKFAAVLIGALCLLGNRAAIASDWVPVGGNVHFGEIPVCALVLINGQTQFSCDGTGRYDMSVPVDDNGMITVMVFADGFAPFNQIIGPALAAAYSVNILLDQNSPTFDVVPAYEPSATEGRFVVSGTIYVGTFPVCALVLANGQNMFSCNENQGQFSLDVPIDQGGNVTLMVFADGFKPYKLITNVILDSDGDGIPNYLDTDDDNDGVLDVDDPCPVEPNPVCKQITDTVTANGKVWAQVKLFTNLSWSQISAVCPAEACNGILNGYEVSGWTWASIDDVNMLFNSYIGADTLGPGPDEFQDAASWASDFFASGWRPTEIDLGYGIYGFTSGAVDASGNVPWAFLRSGIPSSPSSSARTGSSMYLHLDDPCGIKCGGWFFRSAIP